MFPVALPLLGNAPCWQNHFHRNQLGVVQGMMMSSEGTLPRTLFLLGGSEGQSSPWTHRYPLLLLPGGFPPPHPLSFRHIFKMANPVRNNHHHKEGWMGSDYEHCCC